MVTNLDIFTAYSLSGLQLAKIHMVTKLYQANAHSPMRLNLAKIHMVTKLNSLLTKEQ